MTIFGFPRCWCRSQKTITITFPADKTLFALFGEGSVGKSTLLNFSWPLVYTSGYMSRRRCRKSFGWSYDFVSYTEWLNAAPIAMPNISCTICPTQSFEILTISAIPCAFIWQSANMRSCTFVTLTSDHFESPNRGLSKTHWRPRRNWINQILNNRRRIIEQFFFYIPRTRLSHAVKNKLRVRFGWNFESNRL